MNISIFNISLKDAGNFLKHFELFRAKGVKSTNENGLSTEFKKASISEDYVTAYTVGLKNNDFDFLLKDQSYFQFEFSKNDTFIDIRYSFFQNPIKFVSYAEYVQEQFIRYEISDTVESIGGLLEDEYSQYLNEQDLIGNYTTIRYDTDHSNYRPLIHSVSHLHIGHQNNIRIPVNKTISPLKFVLFVIKHVYYYEWHNKVEKERDFIISSLKNTSSGEILLDIEKWCEDESLEIHLK